MNGVCFVVLNIVPQIALRSVSTAFRSVALLACVSCFHITYSVQTPQCHSSTIYKYIKTIVVWNYLLIGLIKGPVFMFQLFTAV
jgi:hypothetical protein